MCDPLGGVRITQGCWLPLDQWSSVTLREIDVASFPRESPPRSRLLLSLHAAPHHLLLRSCHGLRAVTSPSLLPSRVAALPPTSPRRDDSGVGLHAVRRRLHLFAVVPLVRPFFPFCSTGSSSHACGCCSNGYCSLGCRCSPIKVPYFGTLPFSVICCSTSSYRDHRAFRVIEIVVVSLKLSSWIRDYFVQIMRATA